MKKEKVDLTFGIPMYNAEEYIEKLLKCFKPTNKINYEIILLNDGSTDDSLKRCQKIKLDNLKILSQKNMGVSLARNNIIKNAKGKWITFVDSDDIINFDKYIIAFKEFEKSNSDFFINSNDNRKNKSNLTYLIENEIINSPCMKIYNLDKIRKNKIFFDNNISLGEDLIFNLMYYKVVTNLYINNDELYFYNKNNVESLSTKYRENKFNELMLVNKYSKKIMSDTNDIRVIKSLEYIRIKNCLSSLKSEIHYKYKTKEELKIYVRMMKKYKKAEFFYLNNLKSTIIYHIWYIIPSNMIIYIWQRLLRYKVIKQ